MPVIFILYYFLSSLAKLEWPGAMMRGSTSENIRSLLYVGLTLYIGCSFSDDSI